MILKEKDKTYVLKRGDMAILNYMSKNLDAFLEDVIIILKKDETCGKYVRFFKGKIDVITTNGHFTAGSNFWNIFIYEK